MAEPNLVRHAREGRESESRTCTSCNICMSGGARGYFSCAINPATGRERRWGSATVTPAASSSRVVVAGGGVAGLEAARVAALRGHRVLVLEKSGRLGGQVDLWSRLPGREIFATTPEWYGRELRRLGVEVRTGVEATAETVLAERPDAVVVATGGRYLRTGESGFMEHEIPGWDRDFVYTPEQVIEEGVRPTGKVLILDEEGFNTGAGLAELLAEGGASVELVTRWLQPVHNMMGTLEFAIELPRLKNLGVQFRTMTYLHEIRDHEVVVFDVFTNINTRIEDVSAVVMATSRRPRTALGKELEGRIAQVFTIGDALAPRGLAEAIYEGQRYGRLIGEPGAPADFTDDWFRPVDASVAQRPASVLLERREETAPR
jgi:thioredoxin reductase